MQKQLQDNRNNIGWKRGKRHHLSVVVLGFFIAILKSTGKNIMDSNFGEDKIISRKAGLQRSMAAFFNIAINRLQTIKHQNNLNMVREGICEDRNLIYQLL